MPSEVTLVGKTQVIGYLCDLGSMLQSVHGFPHDFFASDMVRTFAYGGMRDRIKA